MTNSAENTGSQIALIDYGMGNIGSVGNALESLGVSYRIVAEPTGLTGAAGIILPGVGAFAAAMDRLNQLAMVAPLTEAVVIRKTPFLGICLGMQLLAEDSTEQGLHKGLGWIPGHVREIAARPDLRVPHVGWNTTQSKSSDIFGRLGEGAHFYYDHGFVVECPDKYVVAQCDYGGPVTAAIQAGHIWATQFHPEKSQRNGLILLRNFSNFAARDAAARGVSQHA